MRFSHVLVSSMLAAALGCGSDGSNDDDTGGKADTGRMATLEFTTGWRQSLEGVIREGEPLRIAYDLDRLTECRGRDMGSDVWGVTGYLSVDGAPAQTFALSRLAGGQALPEVAEVQIPRGARGVAFWFSISNKWGCIAWDSVYGANYHYAVAPRAGGSVAAIDFPAQGAPVADESLRGAAEVVLHVDPARLGRCSGSTGGQAAWSITAHVLVDGTEVDSVLVTRPEGPDLVAADPRVALPSGGELSVWLEATSRWGCHDVDDAGGAGYRFTL